MIQRGTVRWDIFIPIILFVQVILVLSDRTKNPNGFTFSVVAARFSLSLSCFSAISGIIYNRLLFCKNRNSSNGNDYNLNGTV